MLHKILQISQRGTESSHRAVRVTIRMMPTANEIRQQRRFTLVICRVQVIFRDMQKNATFAYSLGDRWSLSVMAVIAVEVVWRGNANDVLERFWLITTEHRLRARPTCAPYA